MELIPIGEAARRLGLRTSALRYYEERGLVRPAARVNGTRMYGLPELRRLAFLRVAQRLGVGLDIAGAVLDDASEHWRATVAGQIAELEDLISRAESAKNFLTHALRCPAEHPVGECPHMTGSLDKLLDGTSIDELAAEHLNARPTGPPPRRPPRRA